MENLSEVLSSLVTIIIGLIIRHFEKKKIEKKDAE
jgi:hypothetical protein